MKELSCLSVVENEHTLKDRHGCWGAHHFPDVPGLGWVDRCCCFAINVGGGVARAGDGSLSGPGLVKVVLESGALLVSFIGMFEC